MYRSGRVVAGTNVTVMITHYDGDKVVERLILISVLNSVVSGRNRNYGITVQKSAVATRIFSS